VALPFGENMSQSTLTESQLHLAVEQLRNQHSNTADLYKGVAALLFFQYDTTPTTNRMYQLVRNDSMSAPSEALRLFWQELRERSQVRMEQADIPTAITQQAGMLIAQLWQESLDEALKITNQHQQPLLVQIGLLQQNLEKAQAEAHTLQQALLQAQRQLEQQDQALAEREQQLTQHQQQLEQAQEQIKALHI